MDVLTLKDGMQVACQVCGNVITCEDIRLKKKQLYRRNGRYLCSICASDEIEQELEANDRK